LKPLFPQRGRTSRVRLDTKQISLRQDLPNNACELADVCSAIDNGIELSGTQMGSELPVAQPDFGEEVKRARENFRRTEPSKTGQTKLVEMFTHGSLKPLRVRWCVKLSRKLNHHAGTSSNCEPVTTPCRSLLPSSNRFH